MSKVALITGVTGQDGSYRRVTAGKGYEVHGIKRRASSFNTERGSYLPGSACGEPEIPSALRRPDRYLQLTRILQEVQPDEVYNRAR